MTIWVAHVEFRHWQVLLLAAWTQAELEQQIRWCFPDVSVLHPTDFVLFRDTVIAQGNSLTLEEIEMDTPPAWASVQAMCICGAALGLSEHGRTT